MSGIDPMVLREEIEQTRADLGDTVSALAARADVRTRVREKLDRVRDQVAVSPALPVAVVLVAGTVAGIATAILVRLIQGRRS